MSLCIKRLEEERKQLKKKPLKGFHARPAPGRDGKSKRDLKVWICGIPGEEDSVWEGACFRAMLYFPDEYPLRPPRVQFDPPLYHPNVYPSGTVCLSIINEDGWHQGLGVREILRGLKQLLDEPNEHSPAQKPAYQDFVHKKREYYMRCRTEALNNKSEDFLKRVVKDIKDKKIRYDQRPSRPGDDDRRPAKCSGLGVREILRGLKQLLDEPNEHSPAQKPAYQDFVHKKREYYMRCRTEALNNKSEDFLKRVVKDIKDKKIRYDQRPSRPGDDDRRPAKCSVAEFEKYSASLFSTLPKKRRSIAK
ncbi:SUMO-conjugating enzyme Ubc9 like protein [Aduncisulcus paluster]|uniref:SUMO-conjugating enzyme Ubc9 like protein n=1 Tax=Aduncisulcus paluster TaxID=2918883 RepID=A0ABQ5JXB8_9EUKA|nr:SUMO-conjugating enzyme Ubc9 like protein [Aduncisulcus paluster]